MSLDETGPRGAAIAPCSADIFATLDLPSPAPLLGSVLARGTLTLIRGECGIGKSWLALSLAHAVARGRAVLD